MTDTTTAPLTPTERDTILEAVHGLLGEMREILHHETAEPGDWAHESAPDEEFTHAARYMAARLINEAEKVAKTVRRAQTAARFRQSRATRQTGGQR
ncbi:hypothetical protein ACF064_01600 [Streptomyces sp. NPDC015492]|uniref:hypothetical protein n=1 Tax=Streptomyces sp. NPDC015492 TaxID=3364958 RepID=UPI0036F9D3F9